MVIMRPRIYHGLPPRLISRYRECSFSVSLTLKPIIIIILSFLETGYLFSGIAGFRNPISEIPVKFPTQGFISNHRAYLVGNVWIGGQTMGP